MSEHWSRDENEAIIADYLEMLRIEQRGVSYSKTAHRLALTPQLQNRTKGSIERKHMNISAALIELGYPYIDGYKPLPNFQSSLLELVAERIASDAALNMAVKSVVEAPAPIPASDDLLDRWERPPKSVNQSSYRELRERRERRPVVVNWLEVESNNRSLGKAGENFAFRFEQARLRRAGKELLADRVEHIAVTEGDGLGFDVRSFEVSGADRLIEVKTTSYGKLVPFFLSRNEVTVSRKLAKSYYLYRVFRFRSDPRLFGVKGALDETCVLDAVQFSGRVK